MAPMTEETSPGKYDLGPGRPGVIMKCGYRAETARQPAIELPPAAARGEHRWPAAVAIIGAAGLHSKLLPPPAPGGAGSIAGTRAAGPAGGRADTGAAAGRLRRG